MKILISGASGLVGSLLSEQLRALNHEVVSLVRCEAQKNEIEWDPAAGKLDEGSLEGFDVVFHLAGENITATRWNSQVKQRIRDSRVHGTRLLSQALTKLKKPPKVLAVASAIGYYGDRGSLLLDEGSTAGTGFLSEVCQAWEQASQPAEEAGIRVLRLRIGIVLSKAGGALAKMLLPFKLGLGAVMGHGHQYMSWIDINDLVAAMIHLVQSEQAQGIYNLAAPHAVTNKEFTKTLGHVLGRPTLFPMPTAAARLVFGEMADALLLASTRVKPVRLLAGGFQFKYPELAQSLEHQLK